jgi:AbiV family abortive infection protein
VDLRAVNAAARSDIVGYAVAAGDNAERLLDDAELLSGAGRLARACSLAVLALEEIGKLAGLIALAKLPEDLRAQAPAGRLLEWHQLKQVGGILLAQVDTGPPDVALRLVGMSPAKVAGILDTTKELALDTDRLKMRGLYVDMDRGRQILAPSMITEAEVNGQLDRARHAFQATLLHDPDVRARIADPPAEAVALSRALFSALAEAGGSTRSRAAAAVLLNAVSEFERDMAARYLVPAPR